MLQDEMAVCSVWSYFFGWVIFVLVQC